jgi:hypothetical protein
MRLVVGFDTKKSISRSSKAVDRITALLSSLYSVCLSFPFGNATFVASPTFGTPFSPSCSSEPGAC